MEVLAYSFLPDLCLSSLSQHNVVVFPLVYFLSDNRVKKNILLSILCGLYDFTCPLGILYKVMYWPFDTNVSAWSNRSSVAFVVAFIFWKINNLNEDVLYIEIYY